MRRMRRISILGEKDFLDIFGPPKFSLKEKNFFFQLSKKEQDIVDSLKTTKSKVIFILQLGIFKKKKKFFPLSMKEFSHEVEFIRIKYFSYYIRKATSLSPQTIREHQRLILLLLNYRKCGSQYKKCISTLCKDLVRISGVFQ